MPAHRQSECPYGGPCTLCIPDRLWDTPFWPCLRVAPDTESQVVITVSARLVPSLSDVSIIGATECSCSLVPVLPAAPPRLTLQPRPLLGA